MWADEHQVFWPLMTKWSPSRTASVRRFARSDPASGSENPWHQWSSALRMLGTHRSFCSSVPQRMIIGPICHRPLAL